MSESILNQYGSSFSRDSLFDNLPLIYDSGYTTSSWQKQTSSISVYSKYALESYDQDDGIAIVRIAQCNPEMTYAATLEVVSLSASISSPNPMSYPLLCGINVSCRGLSDTSVDVPLQLHKECTILHGSTESSITNQYISGSFYVGSNAIPRDWGGSVELYCIRKGSESFSSICSIAATWRLVIYGASRLS